MFEKCDWTKYLINIPYTIVKVTTRAGNIRFDFFFSSCNHNIYILIGTRLFNF